MNNELSKLLEHCLKCSICQSACPVAVHNPEYPGPKVLGADLARMKCAGGVGGVSLDKKGLLNFLDMCSGCQRCDVACPFGVPVAQLIRRNRDLTEGKYSLRDKILAHPHLLGRMGTAMAPLANVVFRNAALRKIMSGMLGLCMEQPFPFVARKDILQPTLGRRPERMPAEPAVAAEKKAIYFPGCYVNYHRPEVGKTFLQLLELLGVKTLVSQQICCGMPLLAAGNREQACNAFQRNIRYFKDYLDQGYEIVTTCPSCGLALKKIYVEELGPGDAQQLASATYDFSEYLEPFSSRLAALARPVRERAAFHLPCHTQAQGTGLLGLDLMRLIPGLELEVVEGCCGQSGTYGFKVENRGVSTAISGSLGRQLNAINPHIVITPCESCRERISLETGVRTLHPVQILKAAVGSFPMDFQGTR